MIPSTVTPSDGADRKRQRHGGEIGQAARLRHVGAISADHDKFAVRDIEHAQQTENHGKPEREHRKRGDAVEYVDRLRDDQRIHYDVSLVPK